MDNSKSWLENGARFGHFTKGVLYGLIGALALQAALGAGGQVGGGEDAARFVGGQPFGQVLLVLIGVGLAAYCIWRVVEGIRDPDHNGRDGMGLAKRAGAVISGVVNGSLAVAVFQMVSGGSGGGGASTWVAELLSQPFGGVLIGAIGLGIIGLGAVQFYKAYSKRFLRVLRVHAMSARERRWVTRMGQVGYSARGVVFPVIGFALVKAALNHDPGETKDLGEALLDIARSSFGQAMLVFVAVGFLAFGAFMVASAKYRNVPV